MKPPRMPPVKPDQFVFVGGLDSETAHTRRPAGLVMGSSNYESSAETGYESVGGYERFDGRARPSDASFQVLELVASYTGLAVGDTINGQTSGATAKVIQLRSATQIVVTRVAGTFSVGENIRLVTTVLGVYSSDAADIDGFDDNELSALAAADYRTDITTVPGSGSMRGLAVLGSTVYAFRDNVGATSLAIYKSTSGGWVNVPLMREIAFTAGSVAPAEGASITKGGATAIVRRIVLLSGTWAGGTAAGRLVVDTVTGTWSAGAFSTGITATCSGADTEITLLPGGRVETCVYNFTGASNNERLYGCDGVNKGWEFDGTTLVPISTGMTTDTPKHVIVHRNHLFFSFLASVQHSGIATPYVWTIVSGAAEIPVGQEVTGFLTLPGDVDSVPLLIFSANRTVVLYGTSSADWKPTTFSSDIGAQRYSQQNIGNPVVMGSLGIVPVQQSQAFGNFEVPSASERIRRSIQSKVVNCSVVNRSLLRMRLFFSDGSVMSVTPVGNRLAFMEINYGFTVHVATAASISSTNRVFVAGTDGYVYETDRGRSFDGAVISSWVKLGFNSSQSAGWLKRYRGFRLEARLQSAATIQTQFEFSMGDTEVQLSEVGTYRVAGGGASYDISNYDQSYYDSPSITLVPIECEGEGNSLSVTLASESDDQMPHLLQAGWVDFNPTRRQR